MKVSLLQEGSLDTRMFVEGEAEDPDAFLNVVSMCQFCLPLNIYLFIGLVLQDDIASVAGNQRLSL